MIKRKAEGVILHTLNYRDYDLILSVYTRDYGLLKLFYKAGNSPKRKQGALTTPLSLAEFVFLEKGSDLFSCQEISFKSSFSGVRSNYFTLDAACKLLKAIQETQEPHHPSPQLYSLLLSYLKALEAVQDPKALLASFFLKLLRHEGLIHPIQGCQTCQSSSGEMVITNGEIFCQQHAPNLAPLFSEEEYAQIIILAYSKKLEEIVDTSMTHPFLEKITQTFKEALP